MGLTSIITFIFIFSCCQVLADDPRVRIIATDPPLDPVSKSIIQEKDKDVQLTCVVENKPDDSEVQWMVERKNKSVDQIATSTRSYDAFRWAIDKPSPTAWRLRIQNAQTWDEGNYKCQVQVTAQNYITDQRELVIVQLPQISNLMTSNDMTKDENDRAKLECYASGRPTPRITWTRLAGELLPNGGTEFQGNVLDIDRIQADHIGIYKCTASNFAGTDTREIRLTVNFRPVVSTSTPSASQAVGYSKRLICNVKGYPQPDGSQISWSRESQPIIPNSRLQIRNIPGASYRITSILDIRSTRTSDFGRYRCTAANDRGSDTVSMEFKSSSVPTSEEGFGHGNTAGVISLHIATIFMILFVCLLQRA